MLKTTGRGFGKQREAKRLADEARARGERVLEIGPGDAKPDSSFDPDVGAKLAMMERASWDYPASPFFDKAPPPPSTGTFSNMLPIDTEGYDATEEPKQLTAPSSPPTPRSE